MNERIAELIAQVGGIQYDEDGDELSTLILVGTDLEKFAELIVKECANRASWAQDTGEKDIGGEVLKHFGVEE